MLKETLNHYARIALWSQGLPILVLSLVLNGAAWASDGSEIKEPDEHWSANAEGQTLAQRIYDRPASAGRVGTMNFRLINKRGRSRERVALLAHSEIEGTTRVAIYFSAPAAIQNTAFLNHEHDHSEDDSWLYLPATERVRRLPASERDDPFMGTDLSYGDIRDNFRFPPEHWAFRAGGMVTDEGRQLRQLDGRAQSDASAREMGYGSFEALIDENSLFPVRIEYFDIHDQPLKRVKVREVGLVGEAWTALRFEVDNHQTGHRTEVFFDNMRFIPNLDERVFQAAALADGIPRIE